LGDFGASGDLTKPNNSRMQRRATAASSNSPSLVCANTPQNVFAEMLTDEIPVFEFADRSALELVHRADSAGDFADPAYQRLKGIVEADKKAQYHR
jgi:hypothetical protein